METPSYELSPIVLSFLGRIIYENYLQKSKEHEREIALYLSGFRVKGDQDDKVYHPKIFHTIVQINSHVAGCDIKKELPQNNASKSKDVPLEAQLKYYDALLKYETEQRPTREAEMGRRIVQYMKQRETERPVIAIVGYLHTLKGSGIYPVLDEAGVRCRVVRQAS